jgi:hypothetical protein
MSAMGRVATPEAAAAARHGGRDAHDQARVEGLGDDVVGAEGSSWPA